MANWIPNTKILSVATVLPIVQDLAEILANRTAIYLTDTEIDLIAVVVALLAGYLVPEKTLAEMRDMIRSPTHEGVEDEQSE